MAPMERGASYPRRAERWKRLEELLDRVKAKGLRRLSDEEVEELARLYRAATSALARRRAFGASAGSLERLNRLVANAHQVIYARTHREPVLRGLLKSLLLFPEVVRATGRYHLVAALLLLLGGAYGYAGALHDPEWATQRVPGADSRIPYAGREELRATLRAGRDPDQPVDGGEKALFASFLWQHNTKVALLCFFSGLLAGIPTILLLLYNGLSLGVYAATFHGHGLGKEWWAWILPHGVTEMLAIVLLAGGGLYLGRQIVAPGMRTRRRALQEARLPAIQLALFAFPMLLLAAVIESYVRQSGLDDSQRYLFAAGTVVFWALYLGRARPPARWRTDAERARTQAEAWAPRPLEEELWHLTRAGRAPRGTG